MSGTGGAGGGWQAALQRAANAFIHYMLQQMKACSKWYSQAAGMSPLQNCGASKIPGNKPDERPQDMRVADEYPDSKNAPGTRAKGTGKSDIPIAGVHSYPQDVRATDSYHAKHSAGQRGFSLLEIMVAFSIMALSLGLLYRITGSSARQVGSVQQHEQAMALAASVLGTVHAVPESGIARSEEAAGYEWTIATRPWPTQHDAQGGVPRLHEVEVTVSWLDGENAREFTLTTLRPERLPEPGQ